MKICVEARCCLEYGIDSPLSGEGRWITSLAKTFALLGHSVDVLCLNPLHNNKITKIPNLTYRCCQSDRDLSYDIYVCGSWDRPNNWHRIKSVFNICCSFILLGSYGDRYWVDFLQTEKNWVVVYPFDTKGFRELFYSNNNIFKNITYPLPWAGFFKPLKDVYKYSSSKIAFSSKDILTQKYTQEYRESYFKVKNFLENDNRFEVVDFPYNKKYSEVFKTLDNIGFLFNLNASGSGYEAILCGVLPFFAFKPEGDLLRPNIIAIEQPSVELDWHLSYPLNIDNVLNRIDKALYDNQFYIKIINGYRDKILKFNSFEYVSDCFNFICERY